MKTIKFRGKRTDNVEWVYGDLIQWDNGIVEILNHGKGLPILPSTVIPETVGQFTGLFDKDGAKIYEKMILNFRYMVCYYKNIMYLCDISNNNIKYGYITESKAEITGEYFEVSDDEKRHIDQLVLQAEREIEKKWYALPIVQLERTT